MPSPMAVAVDRAGAVAGRGTGAGPAAMAVAEVDMLAEAGTAAVGNDEPVARVAAHASWWPFSSRGRTSARSRALPRLWSFNTAKSLVRLSPCACRRPAQSDRGRLKDSAKARSGARTSWPGLL